MKNLNSFIPVKSFISSYKSSFGLGWDFDLLFAEVFYHTEDVAGKREK